MHSAYVPLYPLFALAAYFVIALGLFSLRARWVGIAVDAEVASRPASKLLGRYLRHYMMWVLGPWERALVRWRVTPNALTFASFVVACVSAVCFALGNFGAGGWLYLSDRHPRHPRRAHRPRHRQGDQGRRLLRQRDGSLRRARGVRRAGGLLPAAAGRSTWRWRRRSARSWSATRARAARRSASRSTSAPCSGRSGCSTSASSAACRRSSRRCSGTARLPPFVPVVVALGLLGASANVTAVRRISHTLARLDGRAAAGARAAKEPEAPILPLASKRQSHAAARRQVVRSSA